MGDGSALCHPQTHTLCILHLDADSPRAVIIFTLHWYRLFNGWFLNYRHQSWIAGYILGFVHYGMKAPQRVGGGIVVSRWRWSVVDAPTPLTDIRDPMRVQHVYKHLPNASRYTHMLTHSRAINIPDKHLTGHKIVKRKLFLRGDNCNWWDMCSCVPRNWAWNTLCNIHYCSFYIRFAIFVLLVLKCKTWLNVLFFKYAIKVHMK